MDYYRFERRNLLRLDLVSAAEECKECEKGR